MLNNYNIIVSLINKLSYTFELLITYYNVDVINDSLQC